MSDTIFALASGSYRAGVAIIRVSGPAALNTLRALSGITNPQPRAAVVAVLKKDGRLLDHALTLYFKGPASYTGEDTVEYHLHGGRAVIEGVLAALAALPSCRLAEPGEFTKRAFENDKLDLTEAEAVADLIAAETEAQKLQALDQLGGALAALYQGWTDRLARVLAHQEADIEFPDEDLPAGLSNVLAPDIERLQAEISAHLNDNRRGERLRDGLRVAIVGAPNAGKSSLLNALAQRDVAIVSDEAGTTRDIIETHLDLGGYPVILADTAGLRRTDQKVEAEGIRRAEDLARRADLKIALFDPASPRDAETQELVDGNTIVVFSKADVKKTDGLSVSAVTGEGMDRLLSELTSRVSELFKKQSGPALTRARHRTALEEASAHLARAAAADLPELAAEDLRLALRALGRITGRVHVEELLDRIFRDFCIGK